MNLFQQPLEIVEVFFGQPAQQAGDYLHAPGLMILMGVYAGRRKSDVNLALVMRIDAAGDQRLIAIFQRTDDARHLRRKNAKLTLNVSNNQCFVLV